MTNFEELDELFITARKALDTPMAKIALLNFSQKVFLSYPELHKEIVALRRALAVVEEVKNTQDYFDEISGSYWHDERDAILRKHGFVT